MRAAEKMALTALVTGLAPGTLVGADGKRCAIGCLLTTPLSLFESMVTSDILERDYPWLFSRIDCTRGIPFCGCATTLHGGIPPNRASIIIHLFDEHVFNSIKTKMSWGTLLEIVDSMEPKGTEDGFKATATERVQMGEFVLTASGV